MTSASRTDDLDHILAGAVRLEGGPRRLLPEPAAKALLRTLGVAVPRAVAGAGADEVGAAVGDLRAPLVVKAWGPGIVHKSELGAVRLGVTHEGVTEAVADMRTALAAAGVTPAGFLVEEQARPGIELLVGVVRRPPYGHVALVGLGGTLAEVLDDVAARLCPVSEDDAAAMVDGFRGSALLRGARGQPPVDRDALVAVVTAVAGPDGVVGLLGNRLAELDCNPVIAGPDGAVVADARLVLDPPAASPTPEPPPADFARAFAPRSIAIAGVSTSKTTFGNRALAAYRAMGWTDGLYVLHPSAADVDGTPAYPTLAAMPGGGVDYLLVAVPADACIDLIAREGRHAGIAHVITSGFGEVGDDGRDREAELLAAARRAGVRVLGPNCIGIYAPAGRQTFQLDVPREAGRVSVVSQSGGLAGDIVRVGARRGVRYATVASIGNAVDVGAGEIVEHLVDDPATGVIGLYLEGPRDGERLVRALRRARGHKPVVALVGGSSPQGRAAVVSHTGAMTGDDRVWQAIAAATDLTIVRTLEELLGALVFLQRYADVAPARDASVLVIGVGGGASVLATDACDRAGLELTPVRPELVERLRGMGHGAGTSVVNPVEIGIGPASAPDGVNRVLDAVLPDQSYADVLVHVNVQAYYGYGTAGVEPLVEMLAQLAAGDWASARLVLVARNLEVAPGADAERVLDAAVAAALPLCRTLDEAAVAITAAARFAAARR